MTMNSFKTVANRNIIKLILLINKNIKINKMEKKKI